MNSGGKNFDSTYEAKDCKNLLANYYKTLADKSYNEGRYSASYDNYKEVLIYNPNDTTSSSRLIESGLRAYDNIDSLELTITEREKIYCLQDILTMKLMRNLRTLIIIWLIDITE